MKQISNIDKLKAGDRIVSFNGDYVTYWEFLMVHPHNDQYVLLIESLSQNAFKQYIPNIVNSDKWQTDYTMDDVISRQITYYKMQLKLKSMRLSNDKD